MTLFPLSLSGIFKPDSWKNLREALITLTVLQSCLTAFEHLFVGFCPGSNQDSFKIYTSLSSVSRAVG